MCRVTCKPGSVRRCIPLQGATAWTVIPLVRRLPAASSSLPGWHAGAMRRTVASPCHPYSTLLPAGLAMPPLLPKGRCALTAPFHPYRDRPEGHARRSVLCGAIPESGEPLPPGVTRRRGPVEPGLSSTSEKAATVQPPDTGRWVGENEGRVKPAIDLAAHAGGFRMPPCHHPMKSPPASPVPQ